MAVSLSDDHVRFLRLRAQRLALPPSERIASVAHVVKELCGIQAQEVPAAALAVRVRSVGLVAANVEHARVQEHSVARTWGLRGTLHLLAAEDLSWLLPLLGPVFIAGGWRRRAELGLDEETCAKGIRIIAVLPESSPTIPLDSGRFEQALHHLVDNAVKFTVAGTVRVTLLTDAATGRPSRLIVADTGIGIPSESLDRIFEAFEQVDGSQRRQHDGAGLGLALAWRLCEGMGCWLTVESEMGKGSRFTIRFPESV